MNYRLVIFDSDGTLADTLPWMRAVFNELAERHGFRKVAPGEEEHFRDLRGRELLAALDIPLWKLPRVAQGMRTLMAREVGRLKLFDGIGAALQQLSAAGLRLAVVSSNSSENVRHILGPANAALIAHWACRASMFGKAAKLRAVVRASGLPAAQAIYVGDEVRDAEAARKAGLSFGAVAWGLDRAETLRSQHPALCFERVGELVEKLL